MGLKIVLELVLELVLVLVFVDSSAGTVTNASTSTCHALLKVPYLETVLIHSRTGSECYNHF